VPPPPTPVDKLIDCIDCGGRCHLMVTWAEDNPPIPGDIVSYRCEDCADQWYIEVPEPEE
jgi:hypothetical protein